MTIVPVYWRCPLCLQEWGRQTYMEVGPLFKHMELDHGWSRKADRKKKAKVQP